MNFKDRIFDIVAAAKTGVVYSQLTNSDEFRGDCFISHPEFPMVRYWQGLSRPAADAILALNREGRLKQIPTDTLAYLAHGPLLELPVFTVELVAIAKDLEHPHWMPVLLVPKN